MNIEDYGDWTFMESKGKVFITPGHHAPGIYMVDGKKTIIETTAQTTHNRWITWPSGIIWYSLRNVPTKIVIPYWKNK